MIAVYFQPQLDKKVAGHVLRILPAACDPKHHGENIAGICLINFPQSRFVSGLHFLHTQMKLSVLHKPSLPAVPLSYIRFCRLIFMAFPISRPKITKGGFSMPPFKIPVSKTACPALLQVKPLHTLRKRLQHRQLRCPAQPDATDITNLLQPGFYDDI